MLRRILLENLYPDGPDTSRQATSNNKFSLCACCQLSCLLASCWCLPLPTKRHLVVCKPNMHHCTSCVWHTTTQRCSTFNPYVCCSCFARFVRPFKKQRLTKDDNIESDFDLAPSDSEGDVEELKMDCFADSSLWTR